MEFKRNGGGFAKSGTVTFVGGKKACDGRVNQTEPILFSADETRDIGFGAGAPVTYGYLARGMHVGRDLN
jgi:arylsulfatase